MLVNHSNELIGHLSDSDCPVECEKELALLVFDVKQHVAEIKKGKQKEKYYSKHVGHVEIQIQAVGVSMIVSGANNPAHNVIFALAASIAAVNVTVLATTIDSNNAFIALLKSLWRRYLDPDCLFLVTGIRDLTLDMGDIHMMTIYDDARNNYATALESPKARFVQTTITATNLAVVTEGHKDWHSITMDVCHISSMRTSSYRRLNAIFIKKDDMDQCERAFSKGPNLKGATIMSPQVILDMTQENIAIKGLELRLQSAADIGHLLIIVVNSLEQAFDSMINFNALIHQLAILGPRADDVAIYINDWLEVNIISVGFHFPVLLPSKH
ncbi:hypothetical protein J3E71DRAFT_166099 [Bipolaris maydis]|nr:hypothetical protein J3E71DRAFT_166099 [Bipolaris maydis]